MNNITSSQVEKFDSKILQNITKELRYLKQPFPTKAVTMVRELWPQTAPILIEFLQYAIDNHKTLRDDYFGHLYALFILAEFKHVDAFPVVIKLAKVPTVENILGDCVTEGLPSIIASTYNGDLLSLKGLIEAPNIDPWVRCAGLNALLVLVNEKAIDRQMVVEYLGTLFDNPDVLADPYGITHVVNCIYDLYPAELYDKIKGAYEHGLVDEDAINLQSIDKAISRGIDASMQKLANDTHYKYIRDVIHNLSSWACFQPSRHIKKLNKSSKVGRNDLCPCGSGKKYKKCCL